MSKKTLSAAIALMLSSFALIGGVYAQTYTPTPTSTATPSPTSAVSPTQPTTTASPTPTGEVKGVTVPAGAPATGRGM